MDAVSRITPIKPVIVIKSGSSEIGQKAASSHTGSLAGSVAVYQAAFRQAGMIPVRSIREAFQAAELLASEGYPHGTRAVVISNAGGFAVLSSDYAERFGIRLVEFPEALVQELDAVLPANWSRETRSTWSGDSHPDRYAKTFDVMMRHQDLWDIAFVIAVPTAISDPLRVANEIVRFSTHTKKMIVGCMIGGDSMKTPQRILREAQIPNFPDLEDAFRAVGNICQYTCRNPDCPPRMPPVNPVHPMMVAGRPGTPELLPSYHHKYRLVKCSRMNLRLILGTAFLLALLLAVAGCTQVIPLLPVLPATSLRHRSRRPSRRIRPLRDQPGHFPPLERRSAGPEQRPGDKPADHHDLPGRSRA